MKDKVKANLAEPAATDQQLIRGMSRVFNLVSR